MDVSRLTACRHGVQREDAIEGRDYFHFRRSARHSRHVHTSVPNLEAKVASLQDGIANTAGVEEMYSQV